ncbi:MAG TPA: hypothetical protein PKA27_06990 [Fimbriimonadaceae bacterium]|nr:hypothetical protein [Fimbriimonadaceae bacterium]
MNTATLHAKASRSEDLARLSNLAALVFLLALTHADDYGRLSADPVHWALNVAPGRITVTSAKRIIKEIASELGEVYEVGGKKFLQFKTWFDYKSFRSDYVLESLCPNPATGLLEDPRSWRQAKEEGITQTRPSSQSGQPALMQVESQPVKESPRADQKRPVSDRKEQQIDQGAFVILNLIKNNSINQSIDSFFKEDGQIDAAAFARECKTPSALWDAFTAIYPESPHLGKESEAKLLFRSLCQAGEAVPVLKGAYRYRLYCQQKNVEGKVFSRFKWLESRKFEDVWVDPKSLQPKSGTDYEVRMSEDGHAQKVDLLTGAPWSEEAWRERMMELAS